MEPNGAASHSGQPEITPATCHYCRSSYPRDGGICGAAHVAFTAHKFAVHSFVADPNRFYPRCGYPICSCPTYSYPLYSGWLWTN